MSHYPAGRFTSVQEFLPFATLKHNKIFWPQNKGQVLPGLKKKYCVDRAIFVNSSAQVLSTEKQLENA